MPATAAFRPFIVLRPYQRLVDSEGLPIVHVSLSDGTVTVLDAADFDSLMAMGVSPNWYPSGDGQGRSYVCVAPPRCGVWKSHSLRVNVARLIVAPFARGLVVGYADGNRLNLRRSNLVTKSAQTNAKAREARFAKVNEFTPAVAA